MTEAIMQLKNIKNLARYAVVKQVQTNQVGKVGGTAGLYVKNARCQYIGTQKKKLLKYGTDDIRSRAMTDNELFELVTGGYTEANKEYLEEQIKKAVSDLPITCFKCHGKGTYPVLIDPDYSWDECEQVKCEVCDGTGKITLKAYECFQKGMRDKE